MGEGREEVTIALTPHNINVLYPQQMRIARCTLT